MTATKQNLLDLGLQDLEHYLASLGEKPFRAKQVLQWLHQHRVSDISEMNNLSKSLREKLLDQACIEMPEIALARKSSDNTFKWLLRLSDGNAIETVFIPERSRGTLCVSSQVGCALNCSFCSTGKEGFNRNLTLAEIIGQVRLAVMQLEEYPEYKVTNVVMMGMGEPLLNFEPVVKAMDLMMDDLAYGLSKYRVTLSTSGVIPAMEKLKSQSEVSLAVSLHAPTNELRNQLVSINKKYPLEVLIPLCRDYFEGNVRRVVMFEYVLLDGVNDTALHAKQLVRLLEGIPCKVNLIPFNPFPKTQYQRSSDEAVETFHQILNKSGVKTWTRKTRGDDIEGACGQLAGQVEDRTGRHERWLKTGKLVPKEQA